MSPIGAKHCARKLSKDFSSPSWGHFMNTTILPGECIIQNLREMASGFLLKADQTFQFFFTYGALNRFASGNWEQEGDKVIFNNRKYPKRFTKLSVTKGHNSFTICPEQNMFELFLKDFNLSVTRKD